MDTSGRIRELAEAEMPKVNEMLLSEEQAMELKMRSPKKRKNWMRNQPCTCGSGRKFKKCCWSRVSKAETNSATRSSTEREQHRQ